MDVVNVLIFGAYLLLLVGIGYVTYLRANTYGDYTIAGRSNNKWVTAISAESSDMSGWLLLGLPGMAFASGFGAIWVIIGILFGTLFNWTVVAGRLRTASEYYGAVTLTEYFEKRLNDRKGVIGYISAIVIVLFMIINSAAEIIGSGKLLNAAFGFDYNVGIIIGVIIVLAYTFLGGFLAVSWSNLIQGSLMFLALLIVPLTALFRVGGLSDAAASLLKANPSYFSLLGGSEGFWPILGLILGGVGIGIGYPGQPHILTNFMSIKNPQEIKDSTLISMIWVGLTMYGAVIVGIIGKSMYPGIADPEQVFLAMSKDIMPRYALGVLAAAVMAAILSSVSAYMLVAAASFATNIYRRAAKVEDESRLLWVERLGIMGVAALAFALSLSGGAVFKVALYAWGGLAAGFGPLVLFSLYWPRLNRTGAMWSMITGMVTILIWYNLGLSQWMYELIPGFAISLLAAYFVSKWTGGPDKETEEKFLAYLQMESHGETKGR